jgi:membrane associated rhomboid family serine protease
MSQYSLRSYDQLPPVIKNIIIINALAFFACLTLDAKDIYLNFAMFPFQSEFFKPWQLVTYMFLHDNGGFSHIFFNMFSLWMFGTVLENLWGSKKFLLFYLLCGVVAALAHAAITQFRGGNDLASLVIPMVGASGAVYGAMAAFAFLFPNSEIFIYFLFPLKAKYLIPILMGLELVLGLNSGVGGGIAHFAHLGGAVCGLIFVFVWNKTNRKTFY